MSRGQSWLMFAVASGFLIVLYLLGVTEYLPFVGEQFSTGPVLVRVVILLSLALFLLITARVVVSLRELKAERAAIDEASLLVDRPSQAEPGEPEIDFGKALADLPRDGLLASRVDLLTTYMDEKATTDEVCLLLARQSGLDNEYGELVFSADLVIIGVMNLLGIGTVALLMGEVVTGLFTAAGAQAGEFRVQATSLLLPLMGSLVDVLLVTLVLATTARVLIRIPQRRQRLSIIAADELALYFISRSKLPSQRARAVGAAGEEDTTFDGLELSEAVDRAFTMAAKLADPESPMQTASLLVILARADTAGYWDRIELRAGEIARLPSQFYLDPAPSSDLFGRAWNEQLCFSDTLTDALMLCDKICRAYEMAIVHPGVVALALFADPRSGASRCVLRFSDLTHRQLLDQVQEELVGQDLEGVGSLIQRHLLGVDRRPAGSAAG